MVQLSIYEHNLTQLAYERTRAHNTNSFGEVRLKHAILNYSNN